VVGHLKTSKESCLFGVKMINTLIGLKKEMSVRFDQFGHRIPVTQVVAEPNIILGTRDDRVQLGFGKKKKVKKTENAFVKICGFAPRVVKEVLVVKPLEDQSSKYCAGEKLTVSIFEPGDQVKVTGITKGKGFAGVVKRWGFAGGPKTHGQSDRHRAPGSIGQTTTPGRVFKGKKMAGHMGVSKLTIGGLEVIEVDPGKNLLLVKGSVPGAINGLLVIKKTGKVKGYTPPPPPKEKEEEETKEEASQVSEVSEKTKGTEGTKPVTTEVTEKRPETTE